MPATPLSRFRVIDASDCVAGQFASRLFADYGADVVLVEPPNGSPIRHTGPFSNVAGAAPSISLLFAHLNGGKQAVTVDVRSMAGLQEMLSLCGDADAVIVSSYALADEVEREHPGVLVAVITDFGADGPYSAWTGSELIHQALSGSMFVTGLADREPLYGIGHRASYSAGLHTYIGLAAAFHQDVSHGRAPRRVEVTVHEAAASMEQNFSTQFAYNGTLAQRDEKTRPRGRAHCADGWVVYFVRSGQWSAFCATFQAPELVEDPRFARWGDLIRNWSLACEELDQRAHKLTLAEVLKSADRHKLVLAPMLDLESLWTEEHLRGRDYWQQLDGGQVALGPVFRMTRTPCIRNAPAPPLGGRPDSWPSAGAELGNERRPGTERHQVGAQDAPAGTRRPLEGVRVLDVTSAWAGPMATRILASLGADVIKVEGPGRVDAWRGERKDPPSLHNYPDLDGGARPYNRHAWFNSQNHDKRSLVLDIKQAKALELLRQVAREVDVVIANWSPGALDRVGLGYDDLLTVNPSIIVVEMPAISSTGPLAAQRGLGPTMEAMAGIAALIGYADGAPLGSGTAYLDPMGALHGASAVLTALLHRDLTGEGQHVEVAQREAAMHWIGDAILDAITNGTVRRPVGNAVAGQSPHGAFPAAGADEWVAIGVATDTQWASLCTVLDSDDLSNDDRFASSAGRLEHREDLERRLSKVTDAHDKHTLAARLQQAGVPAAPVHNGGDLHRDPHLRARNWFTTLDHPDAGRHDYAGLPLLLDGHRLQPRNPSPPFAHHNAEVLEELLGLGPVEQAALSDARVLADRPWDA